MTIKYPSLSFKSQPVFHFICAHVPKYFISSLSISVSIFKRLRPFFFKQNHNTNIYLKMGGVIPYIITFPVPKFCQQPAFFEHLGLLKSGSKKIYMLSFNLQVPVNLFLFSYLAIHLLKKLGYLSYRISHILEFADYILAVLFNKFLYIVSVFPIKQRLIQRLDRIWV